jgi:hypothetical protein
MTKTQELVVPRSMPIILPICWFLLGKIPSAFFAAEKVRLFAPPSRGRRDFFAKMRGNGAEFPHFKVKRLQ